MRIVQRAVNTEKGDLCRHRIPTPSFTNAVPISYQYGAGSPVPAGFGNGDDQLANPGLLPEQQRGGEGGLELYFGRQTKAGLRLRF